jgi:serine/threonine protein kinase
LAEVALWVGTNSFWALKDTTADGGFPVSSAGDMWAVGVLAFLMFTGKYPWQFAAGDDREYYDFREGDHLSQTPWRFMPRGMLAFFNRIFDARRLYRATAPIVEDYLWGDTMMNSVKEMRLRIIEFTDSKETEVTQSGDGEVSEGVDTDGGEGESDLTAKVADVTMPLRRRSSDLTHVCPSDQLNYSDNWRVQINHRDVAKTVMYQLALVPPRETDRSGRIKAELTFKTMQMLHKRSELHFPPPDPDSTVGRPCAPFPSSSVINRKSKRSALASKRSDDLQLYFEAALSTPDLAEFWAEKLLEYDTEVGDSSLRELQFSGADGGED